VTAPGEADRTTRDVRCWALAAAFPGSRRVGAAGARRGVPYTLYGRWMVYRRWFSLVSAGGGRDPMCVLAAGSGRAIEHYKGQEGKEGYSPGVGIGHA
jgi:hypothetical protein